MNPGPDITRMAASTCIVTFLISTPVPGSDTLHRGPVVFISPLDQRPNQAASPHFATDEPWASHRVEVVCYQTAIRTGLAKPIRPATVLLAVKNLLDILRGQRASSACHHHRCHPVETDRPPNGWLYILTRLILYRLVGQGNREDNIQPGANAGYLNNLTSDVPIRYTKGMAARFAKFGYWSSGYFYSPTPFSS